MANNSTIAPLPLAQSGFADAFTGSLLSNLAPLVTLFGEAVSKQYLSQARSLADCIIFATVPIGLLSAVVSAIRLGGSKLARTIIGRSRENRSTVEKELLTSISDSVCELWDGDGIVRVAGRPLIKQFHYHKRGTAKGKEHQGGDKGKLVFDLFQAWCVLFYRHDPGTPNPKAIFDLSNQAPNLTLSGWHNASWLSSPRLLAAIGILFQSVVISMSAFLTFEKKYIKVTRPYSPLTGYVVFVLGSLITTVGLVMCCHVLTASATDKVLVKSDKDLQTVTLQKACRLGDESFRSYAMFHHTKGNDTFTSRTKSGAEMRRYQCQSAIGGIITLVGFVCQFLGLLALHWTVTILLLGATLAMVLVRVWACHELAGQLQCTEIPEGRDELTYLTLDLVMMLSGWELKCGRIKYYGQYGTAPTVPELVFPCTQGKSSDSAASDLAEDAIQVRTRSQQIVSSFERPSDYHFEWPPLNVQPEISSPWPDENAGLMDHLHSAITNVFRFVRQSTEVTFEPGRNRILSWPNAVLVERSEELAPSSLAEEQVHFHVEINESGQIKLNTVRLSAAISLAYYTIQKRRTGLQLDAYYHYRLLGGGGNATECQQHYDVYRNWVGEVTSESTYYIFTIDPDGMTLKMHVSSQPSHLFSIYPVFGLPIVSVSIERNSNPPDQCSEIRAFGVQTTTPLKDLLAQELFSNFLLSLTANITAVTSRTVPIEGGRGQRWRNSFLTTLAQVVLDSGLAKDMSEAEMLAITPFFVRGLLPPVTNTASTSHTQEPRGSGFRVGNEEQGD